MSEVFLDAPNLGDSEKKYLAAAIDSNFVSAIGPFIPEFERKFASYVGSECAVSVQSGTAALHISLYELGIGPGDEVIVPALTFMATINPVLYVGARPVIVDVDGETWNIDTEAVQKAVTSKTKAVIPVHLYGNSSRLDDILRVSEEHGLAVIEDATESLGATYRGRHTGTLGNLGCYSFNGNKLITTGGGGMVVSNSEERADHIKFLVNQARDESRGYYHPEIGFNYRMTNIEAALGLAQLEKIGQFLEKKRKFRQIYEEVLGELPGVEFQKECEGASSSWWLTCIKIEENIDLDGLIRRLRDMKIQTRRVFLPADGMPYLREFRRPCPRAAEIHRNGLCLPSSTLNTEEQIYRTAAILKKSLLKLTRRP
jgi:perosamine synthetase